MARPDSHAPIGRDRIRIHGDGVARFLGVRIVAVDLPICIERGALVCNVRTVLCRADADCWSWKIARVDRATWCGDERKIRMQTVWQSQLTAKETTLTLLA